MNHVIREYRPADETSWLRCRVLSFLSTAYFDDVLKTKPETPAPGFGLVAAEERGTVTGIIDVTVEGELATIDTVAVHPDRQHQGIGRALLAEARARVSALGVPTLDAWTRDDPDTLRWYRRAGPGHRRTADGAKADDGLPPRQPQRRTGHARAVRPSARLPTLRDGRLLNTRAISFLVNICRP
ncbi:GNAT family N-acetyltransferase [Streptomyces canus]|uniref:GNAT family N-acetyltransferase n=1 Tax=Streptomyces canus TaxID=58343 RepID=UPI0036A9F0DB